MSEEALKSSGWKRVLKKLLSEKFGRLIIICVVIAVFTISVILFYNHFIRKSLEENGDFEALLDLLEREIKEIEEWEVKYGPPGPPRIDIQSAKMLLSEARQHFKKGEHDIALLKLRELMLMLRRGFPTLNINATYEEEYVVKCILLGKIARAKHWLRIFVDLSEKTSNEEIKELLLNASNTLKQLIMEAEQLVEKGLYEEAESKLDKAYKIINDALRSLKINLPPPLPPPKEKAMLALPHSSYSPARHEQDLSAQVF
ncbi:MAG: hypothetical protein QXZ17_05670 [Nitrososphaerota archaeon]